jgi:dihydrofolate reductase
MPCPPCRRQGDGPPFLIDPRPEPGRLDELHLMVCPIVLGGGKRLFDDKDGRVPLRLAGSEAFPTGVVHLTYQPA